ncbi:GNAT family N-acetyltransferase [Brevibacillus sp. SYSU BS000544]|uniref:GNAT family N-acetyltransferase n=1 Tax=Brevibacillus sp. SYSU BS000544 TaxID=3416443 RepID=UPI003CE483A3
MNTPLQNVTIRHPRMEEAQEITDMIQLCDIDDFGVPDITLEDLLYMWGIFSIETNAWVVCTPDSKIVGYAFLEQRGAKRMDTCVFVHPEYKNQGIGSMLLTKVEARAAELAGELEGEQQLMNHIPFTNQAARNLVESRGFTFSRLYKRMKIELTEEPMLAELPEGMTIRTFVPDRDEETLYEVYDETFRDSWGYSSQNRDEWVQQQTGDQYDPSLWFIVWDKEDPAAFLMSKLHEDGLFIDLLGVKRPWRKQGLGYALLLHAFHAAYERGQQTILLNVDSNSLTNAHYLYERAGMRPTFQTALYRKEI